MERTLIGALAISLAAFNPYTLRTVSNLHASYTPANSIQINNQNCKLGGSCTIPGTLQMYNSSGATSFTKEFVDQTTSATTTGAFSFNMSAAGFTSIPIPAITVKSPSTGAANANFVVLTTVTTTTVSGYIYSGTVLSLLGATILPQAQGTTVYIDAKGN